MFHAPRHLRPVPPATRRRPRVLTAVALVAALVGALAVSARAFSPSSAPGTGALAPEAAWLGGQGPAVGRGRPGRPVAGRHPSRHPAPAATRPPAGTRPAGASPPPATGGDGPGAPGPAGFNDIMVPDSGALWGTSKFDRGWEAQLGRKLDIVHVYHQWAQNFPTAGERALAAEGRLLLINWKSPGSWPAVANGSQDGQITATATRLKAFGRKLFLAFHHEPENDVGAAGQPADYARAFRRVVEVFDRVGADNVIFVWNMMGFVGGHGDIYPTLYPGDQYVDWIAYDPYNWYGCKAGDRARSFAEITKPFYDWTAVHAPGKPLMLAEYGLREQPAGAPSKADWFRDELVQLRTTRTRIKALVYFNTLHRCDWRITSSSASVAAYRAIGQDPFLNRLH